MVVACDPAIKDGAALIAVEVKGDSRLGVDFLWEKNLGSEGLWGALRTFCEKYRPLYVGVEAQGSWQAWGQLTEKWIKENRLGYPVMLQTGANDVAHEIGISSLVPIVRDSLVIPSKTPEDRERFRILVEQTRDYYDGTPRAKDGIVALWLAERVIRMKALHLAATGTEPISNVWTKDRKAFGFGR